jgi:hypothetical protein
MAGTKKNNTQKHTNEFLILDMSDCYTWSFPEFIPFCSHLYYFSSFKVFKTIARA